MKKKFIIMALATSMTLGSTQTALAAEESNCTAVVDKLMQQIEKYISSCIPEVTPEEKPEQKPEGTVKPASGMTAEVIRMTNENRQRAGLSSLSANSSLNRLAQLKAEDMAKNGYFSHTSPSYGSAFDMLKASGIAYRTAGENIAKGQKSAQSVMTGWMNSAGHRENIMSSSYTEIGVGYTQDSKGNTYWVQIFMG
ncbi:MAG: hypothetical protein IKW01_02375 [Firmicutes bacterium]|nr:hypothetical protein [Bacillota bacterium]